MIQSAVRGVPFQLRARTQAWAVSVKLFVIRITTLLTAASRRNDFQPLLAFPRLIRCAFSATSAPSAVQAGRAAALLVRRLQQAAYGSTFFLRAGF
jgi:hypothetical protein